MNKGIIFALGSLVGAASGIVGTYIYMKRLVDQRIQEEVEAYKASYGARPLPHFDEISGVVDPDDIPDLVQAPTERHKSSIGDKPTKIDKVAYHKLAANYSKTIPDDEKEEAELAEAEHPIDDVVASEDNVADGDISIITVEQYEDDNHHEKTNLIWFVENNVICDEFNEEVEDRELLLGDVLDGMKPEEECILYVRNNKAYVDYEIDIVFDSWEPEN